MMRVSLMRTSAVGLALFALALSSCGDDDPKTPDDNWHPVYQGQRSWDTLTTSNGLIAATFRHKQGSASPINNILKSLTDRIYAYYDENTPAVDYLRLLNLAATSNGQASSEGSYLYQLAPSTVEYLDGTNIIHVVQASDSATFDTYIFSPFHDGAGGQTDQRLLVVALKWTALADTSQAAISSIIDLDLAQTATNGREFAVQRSSGNYLVEQNDAGVRFLIASLGDTALQTTAGISGSAQDPMALLKNGQAFGDHPLDADGASDAHLVLGMRQQVAGGTIAKGESGWVAIVLSLSIDAAHSENQQWQAVSQFMGSRTAEQLVSDEVAFWDTWHSKESIPAGVHPYERRLFRQSTAILKMGQVREGGRGHGQILASLIPGNWNISWVRDAAYAIMGLTAAGHYDEAKAGLSFMLGAQMRKDGNRNFYQVNYIERDLGVSLSSDYAISVTRYYGNGTEESDINTAGPNIEWDNWGLFLWALGDYVAKSGDRTLVDAHWDTISLRVADLLIELTESERDLLHTDSSIWERHWSRYGAAVEPETRKHFTYSNICAYQGLLMAAQMAELAGDTERVTRYTDHAALLKQGVLDNLVTTYQPTGKPALAGNLEEMADGGDDYLDVAVVEAINTALVDPNSELASGTIAAFDHGLRIGEHTPGYRRNDDGTWYDAQEWVVVDLRTASALMAMGQRERAKQMLDWVTDQAHHNFYLMSELLSEEEGEYLANTPMCGFGGGAYILALHEYY